MSRPDGDDATPPDDDTAPGPNPGTAAGPGSVYDRYRDALRGGHLAALRGDLDSASRAYREAAGLLPDRAAPSVGLGRVELSGDRPARAQAAFADALQRAPGDVDALDGSAQALVALGRGEEAAELLDRLAVTHLEHDRRSEALAAIERALELAESSWRRAALERLRSDQPGVDSSWLGDLPTTDRERIAPPRDVRERARPAVSGPVPPELHRLAERIEQASAAGDVAALLAGAQALARMDRLRASIDACHDALSVSPADPEVHRTLAEIYRRRGWASAAREKLALVDRYLAVVDDPDELDEIAESAEASGDLAGLLGAAARHAERGRHATALELCFRALAAAPADTRVHLAIARVHLALGWRRRAVDEVGRLARLVELTGDAEGRERVATFVNRELAPGSGMAAITG